VKGPRARASARRVRSPTRFSIPPLATIRKLDPATLRAAWWTLASLRAARKALSTQVLADILVGRPPRLPADAVRGVHAVLRRTPSTCLERALVLQRWLVEHGVERDVIVGVTGREDFRAHAWLEGESVDERFHELTRLRPPPR
jgi:hypothetical protein